MKTVKELLLCDRCDGQGDLWLGGCYDGHYAKCHRCRGTGVKRLTKRADRQAVRAAIKEEL